MLAINPTIAQQVIMSGMDRPIFPIDKVAELTDVSVENIRNFIKRGNVRLRYTKPEGHGVRVLYAFQDVIEIMAAAELFLLGVAPKAFGNLAETIATFTIYQIQEAAGVYGNSTQPKDFQRFIVVFYDRELQEAEAMIENSPTQADEHIARIIVDCRKLAAKAIFAYINYKG